MSEENVDVVRQVFDAVTRRERSDILALYDREVELAYGPGTLFEQMSGNRILRGHDGLRTFQRELHEAFGSFETICEELIDAGDRVVSSSRYEAVGRGSGVEITGPHQFGVWTVRAGKVIRVEWFQDRAEALEAAGLSE